MAENPFTEKEEYCVKCLTARRPGFLFCICGSDSWASGVLDPVELYRAEKYKMPFPWSVLEDWQPGCGVLLAGGPGSGKSSLGARLEPDLWITNEQTPSEAATLLARCGAVCKILPAHKTHAGELLASLAGEVDRGLVVLDSITNAGTWEEQADLAHALIEWTRATSSRLLIIQQINAAGAGAGLLELPHLVDACGLIEKDTVRRLSFWKNRMGPIGSVLFGLGAKGAEPIHLDQASYSVEGEPGEYRLHPWPLPGGRWAGLFDRAWKGKKAAPALPGLACAALPVSGYPGGVLRPLDQADRRRFAELHGLRWIDTLDDLSEGEEEDEK